MRTIIPKQYNRRFDCIDDVVSSRHGCCNKNIFNTFSHAAAVGENDSNTLPKISVFKNTRIRVDRAWGMNTLQSGFVQCQRA
jgi:hypothetical protein